MTTEHEWYLAKEAKRPTIAHRRGHARKGWDFTLCGKGVGRAVTKRAEHGVYAQCAPCRFEAVKRDQRRADQSPVELREPYRVSPGGYMILTPDPKVLYTSPAPETIVPWLNEAYAQGFSAGQRSAMPAVAKETL